MTDSKKEKVTGKAVGGKARAAKMTPEEKKEAGRRMAEAKKEKALLPTVLNEGMLTVGDTELDVAVLQDGTRVVSVTSIFSALGRTQRGYKKDVSNQRVIGQIQMPAFMDAMNLKPFITQDLMDQIPRVKYKTKSGVVKEGHNVLILPLVGDLYLRAREAGAIKTKDQLAVAHKAEVLVRSLAKVGVIALVDEATGYQRTRERDALAKMLEAFVATELKPWVSTFPPDYYEGLFKIYGLDYPPAGSNKSWRPGFIGNVTNNVVYSRLAPDLLPELKKAASRSERKAKLHQWLTEDIGHPKLREHLASIVTLLKISKTPEQFYDLVDQVHPKLIMDESEK
ncbi:P63C domain-containing protein [Morganella morganii]|uniref:P63C domain-containing protein n=1 Tax=Morganella morganii TaxID=582 RepID=UPI001BDA09D5|nr:P63C domain-containing protein [Morganella morganii]MBT0318559.1 P63C domain-containing protein [Morganella morganii subsp. morganii]MCT1587217.1 P63C domain-containing protein [Morganella morganii]